VLRGIFWELLKEEREESVDILASSHCIGDAGARVRVPHIDRLIQEDDAGIVIPRVWVGNYLELLVDARGAELEEETSQRRTARATVEPQNDWVVLWIVSRLEEPVKQMLIVFVVIQVSGVLLDARVDTQLARVDFLHSEVICVKLAIKIALLL